MPEMKQNNKNGEICTSTLSICDSEDPTNVDLIEQYKITVQLPVVIEFVDSNGNISDWTWPLIAASGSVVVCKLLE